MRLKWNLMMTILDKQFCSGTLRGDGTLTVRLKMWTFDAPTGNQFWSKWKLPPIKLTSDLAFWSAEAKSKRRI